MDKSPKKTKPDEVLQKLKEKGGIVKPNVPFNRSFMYKC